MESPRQQVSITAWVLYWPPPVPKRLRLGFCAFAGEKMTPAAKKIYTTMYFTIDDYASNIPIQRYGKILILCNT